jgi:hypothetical protein
VASGLQYGPGSDHHFYYLNFALAEEVFETRHKLFLQMDVSVLPCSLKANTDKKENQILLINKEIQNEAVAKSYITNGLLSKIFAHFLIY